MVPLKQFVTRQRPRDGLLDIDPFFSAKENRGMISGNEVAIGIRFRSASLAFLHSTLASDIFICARGYAQAVSSRLSVPQLGTWRNIKLSGRRSLFLF